MRLPSRSRYGAMRALCAVLWSAHLRRACAARWLRAAGVRRGERAGMSGAAVAGSGEAEAPALDACTSAAGAPPDEAVLSGAHEQETTPPEGDAAAGGAGAGGTGLAAAARTPLSAAPQLKSALKRRAPGSAPSPATDEVRGVRGAVVAPRSRARAAALGTDRHGKRRSRAAPRRGGAAAPAAARRAPARPCPSTAASRR
jgi:hypothetical protein